MAPSQLVSNVPPSVSLLASVTNHLYLIHADNCTLLATLMAASSPTSFRYQTDNGGQYCFCKEECDTKLEQTIKGLRFPAGKYPKVQSLSFQGGWWKNKLLDTSQPAPWCVSSWEPNTTKFPSGYEFAREIDLPFQLYAPYFCMDTPYAKEWPVTTLSHPSLRSFCSLEGSGGVL